MNKNIASAFENKKAFIGFVTAGDPDLDTSRQILLEMAKNGCDLIEVGIPFSDPIAEGPVIQEANIRALAQGVTTDKVFDLVAEVSAQMDIPLVFMTYLNVLFRYGYDRFCRRAADSGISGVIVPDLPYEEKHELSDVAKKYGIAVISLVAPTSHERVMMIAKEAEGFLYQVSSMGVTGTRNKIETDVDGVQFVTARGWEDLSAYLQAADTLGLPVDEGVIAQYLRHPEVARDFAAYWRLYRKYGTDYGISDLLEGTLTEAQYREKTAMASSGGFDEGVSVVNLLLEGLAARLRTYETLDVRTVRLHEMLKRFRGQNPSLADFLAAGEKALAVKEENGLISRKDALVERWVLNRLEAMGAAARERRQTGELLFPCLKAQFAQDVSARAAAVESVSRVLDNAFRFAEDSFGNRQERNLLVTGLSKLPAAQEFIRLHGCPGYLRQAECLLYHKRQAALRKACRDAL